MWKWLTYYSCCTSSTKKSLNCFFRGKKYLTIWAVDNLLPMLLILNETIECFFALKLTFRNQVFKCVLYSCYLELAIGFIMSLTLFNSNHQQSALIYLDKKTDSKCCVSRKSMLPSNAHIQTLFWSYTIKVHSVSIFLLAFKKKKKNT